MGCNLSYMPVSLLSRKSLNSLELDKNQLRGTLFKEEYAHQRIPCELRELSYLSLNNNRIGPSLSGLFTLLKPTALKKLRQLHLNSNQIASLEELCRPEFQALEVLDLGSNRLRDLPKALIHYLPNLTALTVSNNDLEKLPPLLGFHKNVSQIACDGNPLKTIRRAIIDRGTEALKKFLQDKFIQGQDDVIEEWALVK